ncbi:hypothetical protein JKP88DRAFT_220164 [Tribonema minus]|uniref:Uncharacterized protein n=1 Tax=Tribonema minus TaxID=303371 RepID=A0A835YZQ2_9STRA|nr:hypothetical protein JKP88DRAFT_220164 [Tribonema minus]
MSAAAVLVLGGALCERGIQAVTRRLSSVTIGGPPILPNHCGLAHFTVVIGSCLSLACASMLRAKYTPGWCCCVNTAGVSPQGTGSTTLLHVLRPGSYLLRLCACQAPRFCQRGFTFLKMYSQAQVENHQFE